MPRLTRATQSTTRTPRVLPVEIWTIILDLTIHVPCLLDTACTDSSFAEYRGLRSDPYNDKGAYHASERQRLILRDVCSAWRMWADSRKNRYIVEVDTSVPSEAIPNAVRVPLLGKSPKMLQIRHDKLSRWRIIDAQLHESSHITCFKYLSLHANKHPLLRRINLSLCTQKEAQREVILCLPAFKHLTYLSIDSRSISRYRRFIMRPMMPSPEEKPSTPHCAITLPNVRVLEYSSDSRVPNASTIPSPNDRSPAFILNLPQLTHLYFFGGLPGTKLGFEWLTPFTLRGLKSLMVGVGSYLEIEWDDLPNLEELVCINFEPKLLGPIPKTHPLQRVWFCGPWSIETFDALTAGLEAGNGTNLREVHLRTMRWDQEGHPEPTPQEKRQGSRADDKVKDEFCCDKVDRFRKLYSLRTLDHSGYTRDNPYRPKVVNDEE